MHPLKVLQLELDVSTQANDRNKRKKEGRSWRDDSVAKEDSLLLQTHPKCG